MVGVKNGSWRSTLKPQKVFSVNGEAHRRGTRVPTEGQAVVIKYKIGLVRLEVEEPFLGEVSTKLSRAVNCNKNIIAGDSHRKRVEWGARRNRPETEFKVGDELCGSKCSRINKRV